jgi:hypothetical protein
MRIRSREWSGPKARGNERPRTGSGLGTTDEPVAMRAFIGGQRNSLEPLTLAVVLANAGPRSRLRIRFSAHKAASDAGSEPRVERAEGPRERAAQSGSADDD